MISQRVSNSKTSPSYSYHFDTVFGLFNVYLEVMSSHSKGCLQSKQKDDWLLVDDVDRVTHVNIGR